MSFGWTNAIVVPRDPARGRSSISVHPFGPQVLEGECDVVHPVADVVHPGAAPLEEASDRRVRPERSRAAG